MSPTNHSFEGSKGKGCGGLFERGNPRAIVTSGPRVGAWPLLGAAVSVNKKSTAGTGVVCCGNGSGGRGAGEIGAAINECGLALRDLGEGGGGRTREGHRGRRLPYQRQPGS